jgi:hypothetical protein
LTAIRRRVFGVACAIAAVLPAAAAKADAAQPPAVVVVRPDVTDARLAEALTRIEAELRIAGFDVTIVSKSRDVGAQSSIAEVGPAAIIGISGDAATGLEFRIANRRTAQTVVRTMPPEGESGKRAPEILAIYAVELLLASLAELDITPSPPAVEPPPAPPAPPPVAPPAPPAPQPTARPPDPVAAAKPRHFGFETGIAVAASTGGVGPAVLPLARLQYAPLPAFHVRLTGAGLGTRPELSGAAGTASIAQGIVLAEAIAMPYQGRWVSPTISFGTGAHYFGVQGRSAPPLEGSSTSLWSAALDVGVGVASRRISAFEISLEAHALFAYPYPRVRFLDEQKASAGRPTLFLTTTVAFWL